MFLEIQQATYDVLLGAFIALAGTGIYNWNQRRIERNNLRRALRLEIALASISIQLIINHEGTLPHSDIDPESFLPSRIYEANIGELKALHKNEIEAVFQFYSGLEQLRDRVSPYEIADPEDVFRERDAGLRALEELRRKPHHRILRRLGFSRSEDAYET